MLAHYGSHVVQKILFRLNPRWRTAPNLQPPYRYNSAAESSISLKVGTKFDHVMPDKPNVQGQVVKGQGYSVKTANYCSFWKIRVTESNGNVRILIRSWDIAFVWMRIINLAKTERLARRRRPQVKCIRNCHFFSLKCFYCFIVLVSSFFISVSFYYILFFL